MVILPNVLPHPALRPYVKHYFLLHVKLKGVPEAQRIKPFPPDADQVLYFYPRSEVKTIVNNTAESRVNASSIFVGQQTSRVNLLFGEDHLIIMVSFRPGFLHQFLGRMPITAFQGKEINAEELTDQAMKDLNEQLQEESDYQQMFRLIDDYLLKRISKIHTETLPIDKAIAAIKNADRPLSLDWLADQACLSSRQFERKFIERMGMSPKFYARIARFDRAYKLKTKNPQLDWLDVAYSCGYFDFSHLVRDFRHFAEVTPSMLIAEELASPGYTILAP
ncbi:helix-turn-helix domain-containing protein [Spirosoma aerophilum]